VQEALMYGASVEARTSLLSLKVTKDATLAEAASAPKAWSARRTLCFIMLTCGGFWTAVLAVALR
jgi:hypothetical protein